MTALLSHRLQEQVFAKLSADGDLSLRVSGIYDTATPSAAFPFVTFGATRATANNLKDRLRSTITFELSVWSRENSQLETKEIMALVDAVLHRNTLDAVGMNAEETRLESASVARQFNSSGPLYQGRLSYSVILTEDESV